MTFPSRFALAVLLASTICGAEKLPKADRIPATPTDEQKIEIAKGARLHDQGNYIEAIAHFNQVLAESPDNVLAMHELAFSYFTAKEYEKALETARRGAQYKSPLLPRFYAMIGNCLDELGRREEAIELYKAGIERAPENSLLHFNLGISSMRVGDGPLARSEMEQAVSLDPNHVSSHFFLARLYQSQGYRVPAVLAFSRFLLLEP